MPNPLSEAHRVARASLKIAGLMPLSQWIEANLRLPDGLTAVPGPIKLYPYQHAIADAITDPALERVSIQKSARVGMTTLLTAAIAHFVENDPCPVLCLLPTETMCRNYVISDLEPLFETSGIGACIRVVGNRAADRSTLLDRHFAGGSLRFVASHAPRNLRSHTARILLADEIDGMETSDEGDPIDLAEQRTLTFSSRKIIAVSTPIDLETSRILRAYAQSDQRIFEVPCQACGAFTEVMWKHIDWRDGPPEDAAFRCPHCNELIPERFKPEMVANGRWRATATAPGHAGFRLNSLISPLENASWAALAAKFLRARGDTDRMRVFTNTDLGEAYAGEGDAIDELALQERAEPFSIEVIPEEALLITAGVDVQDDRLEVSLVGWGADATAFVLAHMQILTPPKEEVAWLELEDILRSRWKHPLGGMIGVAAACVDSGGHFTQAVYDFCFPRINRRVYAIKGKEGARPDFAMSTDKELRARRPIAIVGTDGIKSRVFAKLMGDRTIRFSDTLEPGYFEQLGSERRVVRYTRGHAFFRFEKKPGARNEAIDCLVYATAAKAALGIINFDRLTSELRGAPQAPKIPPVIHSAWLKRYRD